MTPIRATPEVLLAEAKKMIVEGTHTLDELATIAHKNAAGWQERADRHASGERMDGRASIYTGETYAEAAARWSAYADLLEAEA